MNIIDWTPVSKKIEELIKKKISQEGLVSSGKLLSSIKVISTINGNFNIEAEDYYVYLDEKYKITESVFNSNEFSFFIENFLAKQIEKSLDNI